MPAAQNGPPSYWGGEGIQTGKATAAIEDYLRHIENGLIEACCMDERESWRVDQNMLIHDSIPVFTGLRIDSFFALLVFEHIYADCAV